MTAESVELLNDFLQEALDSLREIPQQLDQFFSSPEDTEPIHAVFRSVHSIKGAAGFFGLLGIKNFAHRLENVLDKLRSGTLPPDPRLAELLIQGIDLLDDAEDPTVFHAFKMFLRGGTGVDGNSPALRFYNVPSRVRELLALAQLQRELIDETSAIPAYMQGEQTKGAARTVGGLSMLMGAANITMKDVVKNFDDGVTKPFIEAMYHWNMQFNDKDEIKGDFQVKALGSTTLIAKEIRASALDEFAASVKNPVDAPWIKNGALLRKRAAARDIEEDVIKTDEEFRADMEAGQPDPIDGTPNAPGLAPPGMMPPGAMPPDAAGVQA